MATTHLSNHHSDASDGSTAAVVAVSAATALATVSLATAAGNGVITSGGGQPLPPQVPGAIVTPTIHGGSGIMTATLPAHPSTAAAVVAGGVGGGNINGGLSNGGGNGMPLQLTTITVAVPAQMSPNSSAAAAVLNVQNMPNVLSVVNAASAAIPPNGSTVIADGGSVSSGDDHVNGGAAAGAAAMDTLNLASVVQQQQQQQHGDQQQFKWKYDPTSNGVTTAVARQEKIGSSLVRENAVRKVFLFNKNFGATNFTY